MNDQAALHAGGIVPTNSKLGKDDAVDTVVARAYAHPVMPGRVVVRLCAEGVAAGDELEMSTLGFAPGEDRGAVGKERKRPLGFPGWALVNDPKNARYALDVVKELKKHARKAKSKPGHAKDAFDGIANRLSKTVPHFLPSYYEEVGRVFIEHGALAYAATMFGKAREVEAVHALEVDEQHRIDGFLEFALAGAVTTKALSEYAKQLAEHHEPKAAYAHFRQLCVQRTLGGMPPWSGMAKELGRLARAAKLDVDREAAALIAEIIESPALAKAAAEFWRAYAEPIAALAKASPSVRGALLNLFPTGSTYSADLDDIWLDLLEASGAIDALIGGDHPPEARPNGSRAAWFDKLCSHLARSWRSSTISSRVFAVLRRMAPALIADGAPIKAMGRWRIDLDLAELALELGVPVEPPENTYADGAQWAQLVDQPDRGRDPVRCAAHPKLQSVVSTAVINTIGTEPFDTAARGKQGFLAAKRAWLESKIAEAEKAALPAFEDALAMIEQKVSAGTFAELPDLHARFAAVDVAPALVRTLRVGIIDEFGWPLLEEVAKELDPDGTAQLTLHGGPPCAVVASKVRAIAIAGDQRKGVHDFVIPPSYELATTRFIGDQFLVVLKQGYKLACYWSSAPHDLWEDKDANVWSIPTTVGHAVVLSDGGWLEALRPMRAGDRTLSLGARISAFDGATTWISEWVAGEHRWREVTASGELGRQSWPAWLEGFAEGDWKLDAASHYLPAPAGITSSPLGVSDGFVGTRIRFRGPSYYKAERREIESIDGAKIAGGGHLQTRELIAFPDGGERRPLSEHHVSGRGLTLTIFDPTASFVGSEVGGGDRRYSHGQAAMVQRGFLHLYSTRDVAGSRRIHSATDDDARALIAAAPELEPTKLAPDDLPGVLAEVTHPRLRKGLTGLAVMAAQLQRRHARLASERAPDKAKAPISSGPADDVVLKALAGWVRQQWSSAGSAWAQIEQIGGELTVDDRSDRDVDEIAASRIDWLDAAVMRTALPVLAVAIGTAPEHRAVVAKLYEHLVRSLPPAANLRTMHARGAIEGLQPATIRIRWRGGNAYVIRQLGYSGDQFQILEYAPSGTFTLPWPLTVERELRGTDGGPSPDEVTAAVASGATSWSEEVAAQLAADTGLTPSEAAYLWAGCPGQTERGTNFLAKELREQLGLKAAQAALARDALNIPKHATKIAALAELGRAEMAGILDGSAMPMLAAAWKRLYGARVSIPEALIAAADALSLSSNVPGVLGMVLGGAESAQLTKDGCFAFDVNGKLIRAGALEPLVGQTAIANPEQVFDGSTLTMLVHYLPFLYAALPVGDPLRGRAVEAYRLGLERVAAPGLWVLGGSVWLDADKLEPLDKMLATVGELLPGIAEGRTLRKLPGCIVLRYGANAMAYIHPASLDARARAVFDPVIAQISTYLTTSKELDYLRGPDLRAMMERIEITPVPAGCWEQNPLLSAPKLVDKAMKKLGVSREAAALYLQYLVLLWPTPKALAEYNGWKPKQVADTQAELVAAELILEAKRERAQRGHFLPGGWEALKSPHPPLESWKLPLYHTYPGSPVPQLGKFQALAPFHLLFERAWTRIESGDQPRYEDVKR